MARRQALFPGDSKFQQLLHIFRYDVATFLSHRSLKTGDPVGRYKSPDEHPFFPTNLPEPMLPPLLYPQVLHPCASSININSLIWNMYFRDLLPRLVKPGDDGNSGSTAVCDTICLQVCK
ncbi:hypothetical protein LOK49_LG13G00692 [Camellia lanceoleosa]|uniref:Uncharacterized protein n=1 Tax=Camellia lanceoleosa TaxID=1840588 RepID=A0ACC0FMA9_9ERIC|nr:hypothetical protein LOK49_LG13G00692 [Camellia lanceoleosa]